MADKNLYKLVRGQWRRFEPDGSGGGVSKRYVPGNIISGLTKLEIAEHGDRLVLVSQAELDRMAEADEKLNALIRPGKPAASGDDDGDYDWEEVLAGSVATIKEYINDVLSDPEMIESLMQAEVAGQGRKTVVSAASERLAALAKTPKA